MVFSIATSGPARSARPGWLWAPGRQARVGHSQRQTKSCQSGFRSGSRRGPALAVSLVRSVRNSVQIHWRDPSSPRPLYSPRPPPSPAVNGGILFGFGAHITPTFAAHVVFCTKFRKHILTSLYRRRSWVRGRSRGRLNPLELVPRIKGWQNGNIQCVRDALRVN